jgi:hypothetical protein
MRWFRSHRFEVASLALFALACQFLLGFGHVHLDRFPGLSGNWSIAAQPGKAVAAPAGKISVADVPATPRPKDPKGLGEDFCAICASINLAGSVLIPDAPAPLPEISSYRKLYLSFAAVQARSTRLFFFNARGPPAV